MACVAATGDIFGDNLKLRAVHDMIDNEKTGVSLALAGGVRLFE